MIHGDITGIRESVLQELERLYDMEFDRMDFLPDRLVQLLVRFTEQLNREVMVYLTREGSILEISIGSISSVGLPERRMFRSFSRLCGLRCIHTHPGGSARLSDVDEQALRLLRFDAMVAIGVEDGRATGISAAFLGDVEYGRLSVLKYGPVKPGRIPQGIWLREIELTELRLEKAEKLLDVVEHAEKALLVSTDSDTSLDELNALATTAGAIVVSRVLQKRQKPDPATFIGRGKAESLQLDCQAQEIDLVIFDDELTGAQQKNLEEILSTRVIDRTALILDIFARRAQSSEGKLQVELAQLKYRLPRLTGIGTALSRLGGGIGTRGPGETQLEVDRRRIRKRIDDLTDELRQLEKQRDLRRTRRRKDRQTVVALVGYTNSGKSTLLNALSGSDVLVEDKLFATLDPVMRKIDLPDNRECMLVDTVGFIRKLPHPLVEAFKSTLEEALYADLLVVVSDLASPQYAQQRKTVFEVLDSLGASNVPVLEALNKADIAQIGGVIEPRDAILISAATGTGLDRLREEIAKRVAQLRRPIDVVIPYDKGASLNLLHEYGQVESEEYLPEGTRVQAYADAALLQKLEKMGIALLKE